jgi:hypothetical protein
LSGSTTPVAAFGLRRVVAGAFEFAAVSGQGGVVAVFEFVDGGQARGQRGRGERGEERGGDGGVDGDPTELQVPGSPAINERSGSGAVVAGCGFARALVEHGEFAAADPACGQVLEQGAALADGSGSRFVAHRAGVGGDLGGVGQVGAPVDITGMVIFDQDLPLLARQHPAADPDLAVGVQSAFELRPAVDVCAGIGRVGQHVVHGVIRRLDPADVAAVQVGRRDQRPFQALFAQP